MFNRYYIIDDFYGDVESLRKLIIDSPKEKTNGNYPGVMSELSLFSEEHRQNISRLVSEAVDAGTSLNGKFRFSVSSDQGGQYIHFDVGNNLSWAGVLYLSRQEDLEANEDSGTTFWSHLRTGLDAIPLTVEGLANYGWHSVADLKAFLDTEGKDTSLWKPLLTIPAKTNRLIIFRPWFFHSSSKQGFGDSYDNCRLIQTFFLSPVTNSGGSE